MTDPSLLAAMYNLDEAETPDTPVEANTGRIRKVRVGVVEYELPSIEYVTQLEQMVMRQQVALEKQHRTIGRMQATLAAMRRVIRGQALAMNEVYTELDTKISISG